MQLDQVKIAEAKLPQLVAKAFEVELPAGSQIIYAEREQYTLYLHVAMGQGSPEKLTFFVTSLDTPTAHAYNPCDFITTVRDRTAKFEMRYMFRVQ